MADDIPTSKSVVIKKIERSKMSHILVNEMVLFRQPGSPPKMIETRSKTYTSSSEQCYGERIHPITNEWEQVDIGWIPADKQGLMILKNLGKDVDSGLIYISPASNDLLPMFVIPPGESMRVRPMCRLFICAEKDTKYSVALTPGID